MHIVIANRWFPPENGWGGVGMYNYVVAHAYRELGHQVTVFASRTDVNTPAHHETDGICIYRLLVRDPYRLRRLPGLGRYIRPIQTLNYSWRLNQVMREWLVHNAVDVVEFAEVGAEGFSYARQPRTSFVVRCHTPTFVLKRYYDRREMPFDTRIIGWCEKYVIRRAHALTTPSLDLAQLISRECEVPLDGIAAIPNPVRLDGWEEMSSYPDDGRVTILHVGRLERVKGVEILAQAIPQVMRAVPNARFVFAGRDRPTARNTSQRAELKTRLMEAGALSQVEFLGAVDHAALNEWYRRADICVVPSMLYESFSYTCAQGMLAGKPVIASRIGGIPETVDDGVCGLLVTPGDPEELANAIVRLAGHPAQRQEMGNAGRAKVLREFEARHVAKQNLKVYERAKANFERPQTKDITRRFQLRAESRRTTGRHRQSGT